MKLFDVDYYTTDSKGRRTACVREVEEVSPEAAMAFVRGVLSVSRYAVTEVTGAREVGRARTGCSPS